jgi:hypothetical protein
MTSSVCRSASILIAATLLPLAGCGGNSSPDTWNTVSHASFQVKMPGDPKPDRRTLPTQDGPVEVVLYQLDWKTHSYLFGSSAYPEATFRRVGVEQALAGGRDGTVNAVPGHKLLTSKRVEVSGYPAIEFSFEGPAPKEVTDTPRTAVHFVRMILVGNQSVVLMVNGFPEAVDERRAKEFWDTLQIDGKPAARTQGSQDLP